MLVKNVFKHKNKTVTSDVDITVVLVVKVKIKKGTVKIFQKVGKSKFLKQRIFGMHFLVHFGMEIKVCTSGEMVRDVTECNSSGGVVINDICVYMIK